MNTFSILLVLLGAIGIFIVIKGISDEIKDIPRLERSVWGIFFLSLGYIGSVCSILTAGFIWMTAGEFLPVMPEIGHVWIGVYTLLIGLGSSFFSIGFGKILLYLRPIYLHRLTK